MLQVKAPRLTSIVLNSLNQTTCTVEHTGDRCKSSATYMACTAVIQEWVCVLTGNQAHGQACRGHEQCKLNVINMACAAATQGMTCGFALGRAARQPRVSNTEAAHNAGMRVKVT